MSVTQTIKSDTAHVAKWRETTADLTFISTAVASTVTSLHFLLQGITATTGLSLLLAAAQLVFIPLLIALIGWTIAALFDVNVFERARGVYS